MFLLLAHGAELCFHPPLKKNSEVKSSRSCSSWGTKTSVHIIERFLSHGQSRPQPLDSVIVRLFVKYSPLPTNQIFVYTMR